MSPSIPDCSGKYSTNRKRPCQKSSQSKPMDLVHPSKGPDCEQKDSVLMTSVILMWWHLGEECRRRAVWLWHTLQWITLGLNPGESCISPRSCFVPQILLKLGRWWRWWFSAPVGKNFSLFFTWTLFSAYRTVHLSLNSNHFISNC